MNPITTMNSLARRVALFALALAALLFGGAAPALAQTNNSTPPKLVGYLSRDNWGFVNIMDFDYDQQGNLYVLESGFGITRVSKFRPDGTFERTFGQRGEGYGQLIGHEDLRIWNLKVDSFGYINVFADWGWGTERQWSKFSSDGVLIGQRRIYWGYLEGGLLLPHYYYIGKAVYISTPDGGFDVSYNIWANHDAWDGQRPVNNAKIVWHLDALYNVSVATSSLDPNTDRDGGNLLAAAPDGTRYVVNRSVANPHVIVLDSSWNRIRTFGGPGTGDVQFNNPTDIKILPNGNLWIHDNDNGRWQEITPTGEWVSENRTGVPPGFSTPLPGQS